MSSSPNARTNPGGVIKIENPTVDAKYLFAVNQIPQKLDAFLKEAEGVITNQDIEYLHRMRVASRRLRAALPLLAEKFPKKTYQRWTREIRKITRILGEARDLDVQLEFLKKYRKRLGSDKRTSRSTIQSDEILLDGAVSYLLSDVRKKRICLQKSVVSSLGNLEKQQIIKEIQSALTQKKRLPLKRQIKQSMRGIIPIAANYLGERTVHLLSYEKWVEFPDAVAEHHAMRIAAKQLRYTMELYSPLYRLGLGKQIRRIAKLQKILGDLHDCDVWIDRVARTILDERSRERKPGDMKRPSPAIVTGLRLFQHDMEKKRKSIHRQLVHYWSSLRHSGFFDDLKKSILSLQKTRFSHVAITSEEEARIAVHQLADLFPEEKEHSEQVTRLALMIFDDLEPIHQMDKRSRFLLECGGLLHDIGWQQGKIGKTSRSAIMILSDRYLPFNLYERGTINLIALWHQGPVQLETSGYYQILSPDQQKNVLSLASLLRIADGLDSTHQRLIDSVSCTINPHEIRCTVIASGDVTMEKEKAFAKSDLFRKLFNIPITFQ